MSPDDYQDQSYQVQNVYRYSRKSFKKGHRDTQDNKDNVSSLSNNNEAAESSLRRDERNEHTTGSPGRSCDIATEAEIAYILNKKCPVITLAQQQLEKLLDETDKLIADNTRCCRSVYDFLCICKEIFLKQNRGQYALVVLTATVLFSGMLLGAATCGSYLGRFNSPILTCIDNLFVSDTYSNIKDSFYSIT